MDALELLGSEHPLTVGAMAHIGDANLGIACLDAGVGFCMTMRHGYGDPSDWNRRQAAMFMEAGFEGRFGMNLLCAENDFIDNDMALIGEIRPGYVTISAAFLPPTKYIAALHEQGIPVGVLYGRCGLLAAHLKRMKGVMADFVVFEDRVSGGHNGPDCLKDLLAKDLAVAKDAGLIVGAGGGVATSEDVDRLLAAGVDFVQSGSKFVATYESIASDVFKQKVVEGTETLVTGAKFRHPVRALPSPFTYALKAIEDAGDEARFNAEGRGSLVRGMLEGDWQNGTFPIGTVVKQITEIRSVADVVADLLPERAKEVA